MSLSSFIFVSYTGHDAGAVLDKILKDAESEGGEGEIHELDNDTEIRHPFGFQPNPSETEPDTPETDDDPDDS